MKMEDKNIKDTHKMLSNEAAKMGSVRMRFQGEERITEFCEANNTEDVCRQATSGLVLVDTHAHLTDKAFEGVDVSVYLGRVLPASLSGDQSAADSLQWGWRAGSTLETRCHLSLEP